MHPWDPSRWKRGLSGLLGLFETRLWGPSRWKEDLLGQDCHFDHFCHFAQARPALLSVPALLEGLYVLAALPLLKQALWLPWDLSALLLWALQDLQSRGLNLHVVP